MRALNILLGVGWAGSSASGAFPRRVRVRLSLGVPVAAHALVLDVAVGIDELLGGADERGDLDHGEPRLDEVGVLERRAWHAQTLHNAHDAAATQHGVRVG
jgi:hypothetical protein